MVHITSIIDKSSGPFISNIKIVAQEFSIPSCNILHHSGNQTSYRPNAFAGFQL